MLTRIQTAILISFLFLVACYFDLLSIFLLPQFAEVRTWYHEISLSPITTSDAILKMTISNFALFALASLATATSIDRERVVGQFNPVRHASSNSTPMQVGNGNFAFGADITGLQTFQPFAIMSSWGWHNFSLPTAPGQSKISDFTGLDWYFENLN